MSGGKASIGIYQTRRNSLKDKPHWRAWKSHNWDSLDRLYQKEYISDPATKAKSVLLTEEGAKRSQNLFEKYFTK
jgi:hypothetical protein